LAVCPSGRCSEAARQIALLLDGKRRLAQQFAVPRSPQCLRETVGVIVRLYPAFGRKL
jgi:hypothetical protein